MSSKILSRRDLDFILEWLDTETLLARPRFAAHSRDTFAAALDLSADLAERFFANHNAASDRKEPRFDGGRVEIIPEVKRALDEFAASGMLSGAMDERVGGMQLPHVVHRACFAWFQAANIATASYSMLTMANAALLLEYGSQQQVSRYVLPMLQGRFTGTMCLSEPQAGSSLSDVQTRATPAGGGSYRLRGHKMWISGGEHDLADNIVHLVLARIDGAPAGVKGISLFVVAKLMVADDGSLGEHNDVAISGINHKMGYRGTVNTVFNLGDGAYQPGGEPGAIGSLVGEENQGLAIMFRMMNEARIAVGTGAAALGYTGYLHALDYARSRPQGRLVENKDPKTPQVAIVRHPDVRRMLLAAKCYAEGGLALTLFAARLLDEAHTATNADDSREAELVLDVLTPVVKSWPSQWCLAANDLAIQVHGGYGYTRDYPVEQFYRDNRLNPIHEGTFGIHAADLLGRKVRIDGGRGFTLLVDRIETTCDKAPEDWQEQADALRGALRRIVEVTGSLWSDGDPTSALINAGVYLEAFGHIVVAWIWLQLAISAGSEQESFLEGKRAAARYFFSYELPRVGPWIELLAANPTMLNDLDDACL